MLRKVIVIGALTLIFLVVVSILHDYWWRCSSGGLSRDFALAIANEKLSAQEKKYQTAEYSLKAILHHGDDWMFTYEVKDCTIDIIVNKCGVADVGGLTRGCF
ncbi:hypothetical protein PSQ40_05135 [Curvibacter sp. HBC61]|uniref:PepSY domain-containing protein n=1 Tax=Curvibacter cyanobacteriorum TaxID=3026422 RepID=A0ABT5MXD1_9BURK|nr:hypothetical protein [Curvibacter sp. HBC61]MDD0837951.1 hypothetical protein [Curvibacter sp. HBC61]